MEQGQGEPAKQHQHSDNRRNGDCVSFALPTTAAGWPQVRRGHSRRTVVCDLLYRHGALCLVVAKGATSRIRGGLAALGGGDFGGEEPGVLVERTVARQRGEVGFYRVYKGGDRVVAVVGGFRQHLLEHGTDPVAEFGPERGGVWRGFGEVLVHQRVRIRRVEGQFPREQGEGHHPH